jgi:hypothetical protein
MFGLKPAWCCICALKRLIVCAGCVLQGQSKLCNVLFVRELNKRLQAEKAPVVTVACHPGRVVPAAVHVIDLALRNHTAFCPLALEAVTGPGSRDPRSPD